MARRQRALGLTSAFVTVERTPILSTVAPAATDVNYDIGQIWIRNISSVSKASYIYGGDGVWTFASPGASDVDTVNGLAPVAGDILIAGGTNLTESNAGHTVTINMDAAITLGTSVSSPIYTSTGAIDTNIRSVAGQDIIIRMGDAAGANKVSFQDSGNAEVFSIDSNGGIPTIGGALTVTGLTTLNGSVNVKSAGTQIQIGSDNSGDAVQIGQGTTARAVSIATANALHTVAIGSANAGALTMDTSAGISLDSVTASNFTITGAADLTLSSSAGSINVTGGEAAVDAIVLNASSGTGGVQIKAGTGGIAIGNEADTTTIGVGDFAPTASRGVTVGGGTVVTAATTDTIDIGPDGATTNADSVKTVNINTGGVTLGQILTNIASGTVTSGTHTTKIATGNRAAGTMALQIMTGSGTKTLSVGNADGLTTTGILGPTNINASQNNNTAINSGTSTGTVTIGGASAGAVTLDSAAGISLDGATASNFTVTGAGADLTLSSSGGSLVITATEASATAIAINASDAASGLTIASGTNGMTLDTSGVLELNSSGGAISIGGDAVSQAASFATAGARPVTIGSTTTSSSLTLQAGTGKITTTGTFKQIDAQLLGTTGVYIPAINMSPIMQSALTTGAAATGVNGDKNLMHLQNQAVMEQFIIGTQTIIAPRMSANGLLISLDLTAAEGAEYNFGAALSNGFGAFTIGTSAAFFFELGLYINDMDGAAPYVFGFRKSEANNATFANYTDYAAIGMNAATSVTKVVTLTELNSAGQTATALGDNWGGDGTTNTLKVLVSAAGVVTYTLNGSAVTGPAAFTFDNADVVVPFAHCLHSASATQVAITSMRIGFQA